MIKDPRKLHYTQLQKFLALLAVTLMLLHAYLIGKFFYGIIILSSLCLQQLCVWRFSRKRLLWGKTILALTYLLPLPFCLEDVVLSSFPWPIWLISLIVTGILYYVLNIHSLRLLLSEEYIRKFSVPLSSREYVEESYSLLLIPIVEEIFFRHFLFSLFGNSRESILITALLISLLFVVSHYNTPWAPYVMGIRDVLWLFILSLFLIIMKISFNSLLLCILLHHIFNIPVFLSNFSRYRKGCLIKEIHEIKS